MFKRRDWRMFNRDDGNSSSDSDSDIDNDGRGALDESDDDGGASSSSSESGFENESGSGSGGEDEGGAGDDSDSDGEDDDDQAAGDASDESRSEETPSLLTRATNAADEDESSKQTDPSKGIAVKCAVCPGVLCLSEKSLQQHLDSKRHKKAMAKQGVGVGDEDVLVDAAAAGRKARAREAANRRANGDESDSLEGYSDGEAETHAERLARLRAQKVFSRDAPVVDSDDEDGGPARRERARGGRQRQRARRALREARPRVTEPGESVPVRAKKGKPGKRQREAAKVEREAAAAMAKQPRDTRPRGNRAAKRAAEKSADAAEKPAKRGAYDFDASDLLAPKPTVDKMRGDLRQMKSGRWGRGRGGFAGGRGGGGRGGGRGRAR